MTAVLRVDLDLFAANIDRVRRQVAPADLMLVVKDDAYGHGLEPIVRRAWASEVRWYGAFDVGTGLDVRGLLGARARVFVWLVVGGDEVRRAVESELDIGIGDADLLEEVAAAARAVGAVARVHLKIDSGLHRNGVRPEDWPGFVARAAQLQSDGLLEVIGVWSHLAEASDEEDDRAMEAFLHAWESAADAGLRVSLRHLAASAASFARPEFRCDLVRVGAFCYGIGPAGGPTEEELGIRPIADLTTVVSAVLPDRVRAEIGALDGLPSALGGRVSVVTPAGPRRLIAVRDDVIEIDWWDGAAAGDLVTVYGASSPATRLAEAIGTIGEEIAVRVSPGVRRDYVGSDR